jgi:hypothetical protein
MAKPIRLSGREASVVRNIGFGLGVSGAELQALIQMDAESLVDVLNTLIEVGYVETASLREQTTLADFEKESFECNPSYVQDLKAATRR